MKSFNFSYNWNNKLNSEKAFTTIRLSDKVNIGDKLQIKLKDQPIEGEFVCLDRKVMKLEDINNWIAYLDTGYDAAECKKLLQTMYKNKNINWTTQNIYFYLIVKRSK